MLVHIGIVGIILLAPGAPTHTPVLFAELLQPDSPPPLPPTRQVAPDRRPLQLPKPIETPIPAAPALMSRREPDASTLEPPAPATPAPAAPAITAPPAPFASAEPSRAAVSGPPHPMRSIGALARS